MANPKQLIKFQVCIHKKDCISHTDFVKWCIEDYPPRAIPLMKKHNVVKWTETIIQPDAVEGLRHTLKNEMNRPKWTVPEYSIIMSYWIRNMDDMTALTTDPEWFELEKEAQKISNPELGHMAIGYEVTLIDDEDQVEKQGTGA